VGDQTNHPDEGEEVKKVGMEAGGEGFMPCMTGFLQLKVRHHDPVNVYTMHEKNPAGCGTDPPRSPFRRLGEKQDERDKEVPDHEKDGVPKPGSGISVGEKPGFFRNVGIPLEEVLTEGDIPPENGEGEKEHAHDMVMFDGKETLEMTCANQSIRDKNEQSHGGLGSACKEIDAPHGGVPVVVQSHQPVKSCKREAKDEEGNKSIGRMPQAQGDPGIPVLILANG